MTRAKRRTFIYLTLLAMCVLGFLITYKPGTSVVIDENQVPLGAALALSANSLQVVDQVKAIEGYAGSMVNSSDTQVINQATLGFLRQYRYGYKSTGFNKMVWTRFAGDLQKETGIQVHASKHAEVVKQIDKAVSSVKTFEDSASFANIDFTHMVAVVDAFTTLALEGEFEDVYYDALLSWGGDLETFIVEMVLDLGNDTKLTYDVAYNYAKLNLGTLTSKYFSGEDFLADIDGVNIANLMLEENLLFSDAISRYYTILANQRYDLFVTYYGGQDSLNDHVMAVAYEQPEQSYKHNQDYLDFISGFHISYSA